ncbi:MAG TPA: polysaccharide biosynthesis/export family protein [Chthoniobacteraceae bacterium]|nr:polysaccharide biosynthesis/export family protein [Chthoniobacteraceae bacterium]
MNTNLFRFHGCHWVLAFLLLFGGSAWAQNTPLLRVGDTVQIRISGVPAEEIGQFNNSYLIDGNGTVNIPFIGHVQAAGLQPGQLQASIESKLKSDRIYTHPTIIITSEGSARFVTVGGNVRSPGRVVHTADLTLISAISAAGGFNEFADQKRVRLVRGGKTTIFDVRDLKRDPSQDPRVLPGDQIDVPAAGIWPF